MHRSCDGARPCERCVKNGRSSTCSYSDDDGDNGKAHNSFESSEFVDEPTLSALNEVIRSKDEEIKELKTVIAALQERILDAEQQLRTQQQVELATVKSLPDCPLLRNPLSLDDEPRWDCCPDFLRPIINSARVEDNASSDLLI
jgi:hypothetical protein